MLLSLAFFPCFFSLLFFSPSCMHSFSFHPFGLFLSLSSSPPPLSFSRSVLLFFHKAWNKIKSLSSSFNPAVLADASFETMKYSGVGRGYRGGLRKFRLSLGGYDERAKSVKGFRKTEGYPGSPACPRNKRVLRATASILYGFISISIGSHGNWYIFQAQFSIFYPPFLLWLFFIFFFCKSPTSFCRENPENCYGSGDKLSCVERKLSRCNVHQEGSCNFLWGYVSDQVRGILKVEMVGLSDNNYWSKSGLVW